MVTKAFQRAARKIIQNVLGGRLYDKGYNGVRKDRPPQALMTLVAMITFTRLAGLQRVAESCNRSA
jgi:hypothetical protein